MMEQINLRLQDKYRLIAENETRWEHFHTEDAEFLIVAYGLAARIAKGAVEMARAQGIRAGLLRPVTLFPYPTAAIRRLADTVRGVLVVEMNAGQMIEDVRLAVEGRVPVKFYGRMGGIIPAPDEVLGALERMVKEDVAQHEEAY
jgi:2-oxoglutarate ferredoxin oxidoreductase subunit alpha